jgi:hypothetical protein
MQCLTKFHLDYLRGSKTVNFEEESKKKEKSILLDINTIQNRSNKNLVLAQEHTNIQGAEKRTKKPIPLSCVGPTLVTSLSAKVYL